MTAQTETPADEVDETEAKPVKKAAAKKAPATKKAGAKVTVHDPEDEVEGEGEEVDSEPDFYATLVFVLERKYPGNAIEHAEREFERTFHARPSVIEAIKIAVDDIISRRYPNRVR